MKGLFTQVCIIMIQNGYYTIYYIINVFYRNYIILNSFLEPGKSPRCLHQAVLSQALWDVPSHFPPDAHGESS